MLKRCILKLCRIALPTAWFFQASSNIALAADKNLNLTDVATGLDTIGVLLAEFLVFFVQAGFGMVEAGFIRAKNTCNILTKNFLDYCMASLGFFMFGYAIMFGVGNGSLEPRDGFFRERSLAPIFLFLPFGSFKQPFVVQPQLL